MKLKVYFKNLFIINKGNANSNMLINKDEYNFVSELYDILKENENLIIEEKLDICSSFGVGAIDKNLKNPINENYLVGGSSSESSIIQYKNGINNIESIAITTDTGGSTRLPAAYTNIYGYKPKKEFISRHGLYSFSDTLDSISLMSYNFKNIYFLVEYLEEKRNLFKKDLRINNYNYIENLFYKKILIISDELDNYEHIYSSLKNKYIIDTIDIFKNKKYIEDLNFLKELYINLTTLELKSNLYKFKTINNKYSYNYDKLDVSVKKRINSINNNIDYYNVYENYINIKELELYKLFTSYDLIISCTTPYSAKNKYNKKNDYDIFVRVFNIFNCSSINISTNIFTGKGLMISDMKNNKEINFLKEIKQIIDNL